MAGVVCLEASRSAAAVDCTQHAQMTRWTAELGGFLGRKSDGNPGSTTLGRGLQRLHDILTGFLLAKQLHSLQQSTASKRPVPAREVTGNDQRSTGEEQGEGD